MAKSDTPLRANEVGAYGELMARPNPEGLIILNEPPLEGKLSVLGFRLRRTPTLEEIAVERDQAPGIALSRAAAEQMMAARARQGLC